MSASLMGSSKLGSMAQRPGLMGDSPAKVEARAQLQEMLEAAVDAGASTRGSSSGNGPLPSVPSSSKGIFGGGSDDGTARKGNGLRGRGKGGGKGKLSTKGARLADHISNTWNLVWCLCRLVCARAQEFRRRAREHNQVVAFTRLSTLPTKLNASKKTWMGEIPPKSELAPFPVHPDHPWGVAAMVTVGAELKVHMSGDERNSEYEGEELAALRDAAKVLTHEATLRVGLHRSWKLRGLTTEKGEEAAMDDEDADGDGEAELWMMRFASNQPGQKLNQAMHLLGQQNVIDECLRVAIRADRAPKGGLQRQLEGLLGDERPQKSSAT